MEKKIVNLKEKLLPVILTVLVIVLDQITKALVVKYIPYNPQNPYENYDKWISFLNGFFRIIHVRNTGVAFSVGATWGQTVRNIMFSLIPILVIGLVFVIYFRNNDFTKLQRWAITGIAGGGIGNIIDRIFRPAGVVDFLDVQWFGIENCPIPFLRMTRWPTFNVADSAVVVCGIMLVISFIVTSAQDKKRKENKTSDSNADQTE